LIWGTIGSMRIHAVCFVALVAGCGATSGEKWVGELPADRLPQRTEGQWSASSAAAPASSRPKLVRPASIPGEGAAEEPLAVEDFGDGVPRVVLASDAAEELFRNTYYDFPSEGRGAKEATIFDAACAPIARVTADFHDRVCVQGSGRIEGGGTVSFAKRGCTCAAVCPRTGQQVCFELLDRKLFPHGRGATGQAITPLRTVAVDSTVIPLGTAIFVPEFVGLPRGDGTKHDGCFLAEDRGLKVVGRQIDVFTGDPSQTARWNALVPSNRGVHVKLDDPRCHGK
jgi:3D (Asp-Asp-Asp) domain-containing protein